jgi:hypothetical protein
MADDGGLACVFRSAADHECDDGVWNGCETASGSGRAGKRSVACFLERDVELQRANRLRRYTTEQARLPLGRSLRVTKTG